MLLAKIHNWGKTKDIEFKIIYQLEKKPFENGKKLIISNLLL